MALPFMFKIKRSISASIAQIPAQWQKIDILINNASSCIEAGLV